MPENRSQAGSKNGVSPTREGIKPPSISLPKGGGAIRGIGEKFAANPVTGTGSMTVPIATSPGRSGFGPQLSLSYDSGAGNGPFGFGWSSLASLDHAQDRQGICRKYQTPTSRTYSSCPAPKTWFRFSAQMTGSGAGRRLNARSGVRPTAFSATAPASKDCSRASSDGPTLADLEMPLAIDLPRQRHDLVWQGRRTAASPIPPIARAVFSWLICESYDDKGNVSSSTTTRRERREVSTWRRPTSATEATAMTSRAANRYLKRIQLRQPHALLLDGTGRRPLLLTHRADPSAGWMFEVVFDYGEHDCRRADSRTTPAHMDAAANDPFSIYRAGFEVRTYRLCQRVLMFHHFPGEAGRRRRLPGPLDRFHVLPRGGPCRRAAIPSTPSCSRSRQSGYKRHGGGYLRRSRCRRSSSNTRQPDRAGRRAATSTPEASRTCRSVSTARPTSGSISTARASPAS